MMAWSRDVHEATEPYSDGDVYVNLLSLDEKERIPDAFGPNYDRLATLKSTYDPENLFRSNHNVTPAA
jgi:FAD/FMN-containing dehydrogenase